LDRKNIPLNITYENKWNTHDIVNLFDVPEFMQQAIIAAEDKRFYAHDGIDWLARLSALKQNVLHIKGVRGASTITEQVVKMLHRRKRTVWTRWLEGFEAQGLENTVSKSEILEFYLNQVPYAARRRGIKQAALYYFNRDLQTLNKKEMLALAVMVRSPKWLNPFHYPKRLNKTILTLAERMQSQGIIDKNSLNTIRQAKLITQKSKWHINTQHFLEYAKQQYQQLGDVNLQEPGSVYTTLDVELQRKVQKALDTKLHSMRNAHVLNGAVLIVEHGSNEIISWVVGQAGKKEQQFNNINAVLAKRQPGSALKPFLYASALNKGWTAATIISDTPLEESVGLGLHSYHNYSREYYGLISLRESLGNSLNIPAVRTIQYVGVSNFLQFLKNTGIKSLTAHPNVYGDGIALGNGELTLFELTQAYTTLARMGSFKPLSTIAGQSVFNNSYPVIKPDIASLITNILSDPKAREREFGSNSILNFPQQTAVKTGTSSDYRDAWAIGYNDRYTIGVWFGNMDYSPMQKVTGSTGPALVLRSLFNEVNRGRQVRGLYHSPYLVQQRVCIDTGIPANGECRTKDEWFIPGTHVVANEITEKIAHIRKPTNGLRVAMDPRVPDKFEVFEFELNKTQAIDTISWFVNGEKIGTSSTENFHWTIKKGQFQLMAKILYKNKTNPVWTKQVNYTVF
ncbi:MAG: transglycosylase domain-containing protein, partial [Thiohalomonadales bacterium]